MSIEPVNPQPSYIEASEFLEEVEEEFRGFAESKDMFDFEYDIDYHVEEGNIVFWYGEEHSVRKAIGVSGPYGDSVMIDGCAYRRSPQGLQRSEMPVGQVSYENLQGHMDAVYGALEDPDSWDIAGP